MEEFAKILVESVQALKELPSKNAVTTTVNLPEFDPKRNDDGAFKWCLEIENLGLMFGWTDYELVIRGASALVGDAKEWFSAWKPDEKTWENFRAELSSMYPAKKNLSEKFRKASLYTSDQADSYCEYARKKISLIKSLNFTLSDSQLLELVIGDITNIQVKTAAFNSNIESASELLMLLDNYKKSEKVRTVETGKLKRNRPFESNANLMRCFTCNQLGHIARSCPKKRFGDQSVETNSNKRLDSKHNKIICSFCNKIGHKVNDCFRKKREEPSSSRINYFCVRLDSNFCTKFEIQGQSVECLVDTGAECSLLSEKIVKRLSCHLEPALITLNGIGGGTTFANSKTILNIERNGTAFEVCFYIVDSSSIVPDAILGRDLFTHKGLEIRTNHYGTEVYLTEDTNASSKLINNINISPEIIKTPLIGDQLLNLMKLLSKYSSNITTGNAVTAINTAELSIRLKEEKIINFHPYRMALCEREKVKSIISDLLNNNIIRESDSPYASPILLVHKKDGSSRLCVDYRALNRITIKDRYPLPLIQDQLDNLARNKYFTTLDMASGFHQVPLAEDSIEKTAFVTPDGHYEYLRVPFGLSNAPAVFQRAICKAVGKLKDKDALVYLDDILIPSKSVAEGLDKLDRVLASLTKAGFSLNINKCHFFECQIEYLGQEISEMGMRPGKSKTEALLRAPDPKNVREVRQFMGLANYFRKFIPELSARTSSITNLTKNNEKFVWGDEQKIAKAYVCAYLSQRPLLVFFDPNLETELHTDASSVGFGALLF